MAPWGGRTLDRVLVGGLVVSATFAARPRAHFVVRTTAVGCALVVAARLWFYPDRRRASHTDPRAMTNSMLVSVVAHEIRAPLAAIRGAVALLDEHDGSLDPQRRRELLAVSLDATKALTSLVDDLVLISRIAGGRLRIERDIVDLVRVVQEACDAEMSLAISVVDQIGVPPAFGDAVRIRQIVTNLVSNAVANALPSSVVLVAITGANGKLRVTIYNEGRGIAPEDQSRLFLPFAALGERRIDSTGLGLFIAKELVEAMDGEIGFTTQPGRNAAFWFTLPAAAR